MKFSTTTLGEISGGGSYGLGASASVEAVGPKFLRTTDIVTGNIDWLAVPYCEADQLTLDKYRLSDGDIVISRTGANAGLTAYVEAPPVNSIFAGYLVRFKIDETKADSRFISYVLLSDSWTHYVEITRTGSAQPQFNAKLMGDFPIALPSIAVQKSCAAVLGALDEKIQANKQLSKTLEDIAQTIFQSWFIDFDPVKGKMSGEKPVGMDAATAALFPDAMKDSELGLIPAGWQKGNLGQILDIFDSRRVPISGAERKKRSGSFPYYGAAGVIDFIDDYLFTGPHVLVGEDGTVITNQGKPIVQYVWGNFWVSNHAHVLKGIDEISVEYLKLVLDRVDISNFITGAVQLKLNQGNLKAVSCLIPASAVLLAFDAIIQPIFEEIRNLSDTSKSLIDIRDSLLPRLISGELQIPEEMLAS